MLEIYFELIKEPLFITPLSSVDFCLQKSSISTSYFSRSFVGLTQICLRFPYYLCLLSNFRKILFD